MNTLLKMKANRMLQNRFIEQEFSYRAPGALRVHLAGSFTRWQNNALPMRKGKDGLWRLKVMLEPGTYRYRFMVDGEWRNESPDCTLRVPNRLRTSNVLRD